MLMCFVIVAATYKYQYITRPDPHRAQVGNVGFYLELATYQTLKSQLQAGETISTARIFDLLNKARHFPEWKGNRESGSIDKN